MVTERGLVVPGHELIATDPDPQTGQDALAIFVKRGRGGFTYCGANTDLTELYFRQFCGPYVDLMSLDTVGDRRSGVMRFERRDFPWPQDEQPDPLKTATGSIVDVVRQVLAWPTS